MLIFSGWTSANWQQPKAVLPAGPRVLTRRCLLVSITSRSNRVKHLSFPPRPGSHLLSLKPGESSREVCGFPVRQVPLLSNIFTWEMMTEAAPHSPLLHPVCRLISTTTFEDVDVCDSVNTICQSVKHWGLTSQHLIMLHYLIGVTK